MKKIIVALAAVSLLLAGCGQGQGQEKLDSEGRAACLTERDANLGMGWNDQVVLKRGAYSSNEAVAQASLDLDSAIDVRKAEVALDSPTSQAFLAGKITAAEADAINAPGLAKFEAVEQALIDACGAAGVNVGPVKAAP